MSKAVTIAGAGLAGGLLALLLARRGYAVDVFERRPDPRVAGYLGGRSINLALAERGMHGLREAGLTEEILRLAVMMRGRQVHFADGSSQLQRYGRDDSEVIWSINRGRLNLRLLDAAEAAGARLHFDQALVDGDLARGELMLRDERDGTLRRAAAGVCIGADGAGSALRGLLGRQVALDERFEPLGHGYKELEIPPSADGGFRIERNALHIWPRGGYMCIALPNAEGSFTVTLFLPNEGDPSFATLPDVAAARRFFERDFPDALPLIPEFDQDFHANPVGLLGTLRLARWHHGSTVLVGDAAHAMVPFHGQGMNCAFEDCVELAELAGSADWPEVFAEFERRRRPNAEAIQAMALENYIEMRDRVDDPDYLLQKALERELAELLPGRFVPRYAMVTFRRTPYAVARARGLIQSEILAIATRGRKSLAEVDIPGTVVEAERRLAVL
jgi:kynurenine 3-monooxygenase